MLCVLFVLNVGVVNAFSEAALLQYSKNDLYQEVADTKNTLMKYKVATAVTSTILGTLIFIGVCSVGSGESKLESVSKKLDRNVDITNKRLTALELLISSNN